MVTSLKTDLIKNDTPAVFFELSKLKDKSLKIYDKNEQIIILSKQKLTENQLKENSNVTTTVSTSLTISPTMVRKDVKVTKDIVENNRYVYQFKTSKPFLGKAKPEIKNLLTFSTNKISGEITNIKPAADNKLVLLIVKPKEKSKYKLLVYKVYIQEGGSGKIIIDDYLSDALSHKKSIEFARNAKYVLIKAKDELIAYNLYTDSKTILFDTTQGSLNCFDSVNDFVMMGTGHKVIFLDYEGIEKKETMFIPGIVKYDKLNSCKFFSDNGDYMWVTTNNNQTLLIGDLIKDVGGKQLTSNNEDFKAKWQGSAKVFKLLKTTGTEYDLLVFDKITPRQMFINSERDFVIFVTKDKVIRFNYNREQLDVMNHLGEVELMKSDKQNLEAIKPILNFSYILLLTGNEVHAVSVLGENNYVLAKDTAGIDISDDRGLMFIKKDSIFFRELQ